MNAKWGLLIVALAMVVAEAARAGEVTIYYDKFGVPSIHAPSLLDATSGLGYAMAQQNAEQMARNYKFARGRLAEVDGRAALLQDGFLRGLGLEEIAQAKAKSLTGEMGAAIRAFCDGANRALSEQKRKSSSPFGLPSWVEPFTPTDVLAAMQLVNAAFPLYDLQRQLFPGIGSNQFAVGRQRSASGHPILSIDPHLLWSGPLVWTEFALYTSDFNFRGITAIGLPLGVMGHTDKVAWCMTNNNPQLFDFFTVQTNPDNAKQYNFHGEWRDFEELTLELRYREEGELKSLRSPLRRTAWGPMIPLTNRAVKLSMLGSWELMDQGLRMMRAQNAKQLREAMRPLGFSMWNVVYADVSGNIGYQYNARVPRRDESPDASGGRLDWSKPVNGADPKTRWGPFWTIDELPHVDNPKSNLLVNCNSAPWLTPLGDEIKSTGWPRYVTSYGHTPRYDSLAALLSRDAQITIEKAKQYATDTKVPYARKAIAALRRAATQRADVDGDLRDALAVLSSWNGRADVDAKGCALFAYWLRAATERLARTADSPAGWTMEDSSFALNSLRTAATMMKQEHGRLDVPWGELHVAERGNKTTPVSGFGFITYPAFSDRDIAAVAPNFGPFKNGKIVCEGGSSFRMIVHLDPKGVQSWSILPYGNAHDPTSPHYADQMELFGRGEYKDTVFGLSNIRQRAVSKQTLLVPPAIR